MTSHELKMRCAHTELPACIWMQAGVICRKYCNLEYDCAACHFDKAMVRAAEKNKRLRKAGKAPAGPQGRIVFWKDKLRELPTWKRPCLHFMKGRIDFRSCNHNYKCGTCEFDQYFQDQYSVHALIRTVAVLDVDGFKVPQGYYLHRGHAWLKIEEGTEVCVGMDDFALRLLGPLDEMTTPLIGKRVRQGAPDIGIRKGGRRANVLSPVSGVVTTVNPTVQSDCNAVSRNPYDSGWILKIHADNLRGDLRNLMIADETRAFLKDEVDQLYDVIEEEIGLAADGGQLGSDIAGNLPEACWPLLVGSFLKNDA